MKILFFVSSLNAGGAERVATTLANAWAGRGDEVVLAPTYLTRHASFYPVDDAVTLAWLADARGRWLSRALPGLGKWLQIRALIRDTRPDVVISFLTNVNVNVLIASAGMDVPVVVCERTNPAHSQSAGRLLRLLRRLTYRRARVVVLQTQASVDPFRALVPGLRDVRVVPNPLPAGMPALLLASKPCAPDSSDSPDSPGPAAPVSPVSENTPGRGRMVAMGRLVAIKQFDLLIDSFGRLASRYPDWDLTIWGDGPLRGELQQKIQERGLSSRISLAGRTAEPWQALSRADIFVMTSRVEGFPNVLMEAMALGLPCVALDCPSGPAELTRRGEDARLVPLHQSGALINALQGLMQDEAERHRLGRKAAASVRQRYGLPTILAQWDDIFTHATQRDSMENT